jgi:hypothetical protein
MVQSGSKLLTADREAAVSPKKICNFKSSMNTFLGVTTKMKIVM